VGRGKNKAVRESLQKRRAVRMRPRARIRVPTPYNLARAVTKKKEAHGGGKWRREKVRKREEGKVDEYEETRGERASERASVQPRVKGVGEVPEGEGAREREREGEREGERGARGRRTGRQPTSGRCARERVQLLFSYKWCSIIPLSSTSCPSRPSPRISLARRRACECTRGFPDRFSVPGKARTSWKYMQIRQRPAFIAPARLIPRRCCWARARARRASDARLTRDSCEEAKSPGHLLGVPPPPPPPRLSLSHSYHIARQ
jgi:hypothetical protein